MSLVARVLARVPPAIADELRSTGGLEEALEALVRRGRAAYPDVSVDDDAWAAHLARHLGPGEVGDQLAEMHADVHLALGCLARNPRALVVLQRRIRDVAPCALSRMRLEGIGLDELLLGVYERLLVVHDEAASPKLATYSGRGPLDGWLRVTVARTAITAMRRRGADDDRRDEMNALLSHAAAGDPELEALRNRFAPMLARAIEDAVATLSDQDRVLLRLHFVDGLSINDIAAVYGRHRTTAARHLASVRSAIFGGARERAMKALGIGEAEFGSLMGVLLSRLDVTIRRYLDEDAAHREAKVGA